MQVVTNMNGVGLGTFEQGQSCGVGEDFICGPRGGIISCRPCDSRQLASFKQLQKLANQLVVSLGLENSPAIIVKPNSCEGGDILALDGRVGPCTRRTISKIVRVAGPIIMKPTDPILGMANFQPKSEYIAHVIPELIAYMEQLVVLSNAPKNVPAPSQQPIKNVPAPGSVPVVIPDTNGGGFRPPAPRVSRAGITLGVFGFLAAVGLISAGVYYYEGERS